MRAAAAAALLGAMLLSACSETRLEPELVCVDAMRMECREAADVALAAVVSPQESVTKIRVERGRAADCTTEVPNGTVSVRAPCPEAYFDFYANVSVRFASGRTAVQTIVREKDIGPMTVAPCCFL